jgi:hypothetical protein
MKERYYIVSIEPRPRLSNPEGVFGVIVPYDKVFNFYQAALKIDDFDGIIEDRDIEAKRQRDEGISIYDIGTGCRVQVEHWTEKEYFQKRLEGYMTLEEFRESL